MASAAVCLACHRQSPSLRLCGQCKLAYFCDGVCQRKIWKAHKPVCLAASNPSVDMQRTAHCGNGLVATKAFRAGDLILVEKAQFVTKQELARQNALTQLGYTLTASNGDDVLASHGPIMSLINHACVPNARVKREAGPFRKLYARRDIAAGDEICTMYDATDDNDECATPAMRAAKRASLLARFGLACKCTHCVLDQSLDATSDDVD
ncbi:hypothetical protein SDRG_05858 [Saprolegnia diclina VS20]|uniref:MYND-type domain-containing protein n=1 Tax=Saprolegnia diclina (strain VS20) TaxID=1156394 RepID=T0QR70_SAPDV|nr:hypothetical protein SDRG_05858 [Saprolegnia diclina VS20]EQC36400.1 hypothetical protein SDRG_05858 [Saprolegnia diclina VS20]|eukprot:XP_008609821.1 hypothetical protein SDRG_05858 [Saprolegnia diclina VS20]